MDVDVGALGDGLDGFADGPAIFEYRLVLREVTHGDFVAQGDSVAQFDLTRGFAFESYGSNRSPLFQVSDGDSYVVVTFMQENSMFHISSIRD
jgi:hypothetical protein